jgi:high-affinity iron transporter
MPEMLGQYLIAFRESLEASLIVVIMLSYLSRTFRSGLSRYIWIGVYSAIITSILIGVSIFFTYGMLDKVSQLLFEAVAAFTAVVVLSYVVRWMALKGRYIREEVERKIEEISSRRSIIGLLSFSFIIVFREGLETVLFLTPFYVTEIYTTVVGAILALASSLLFSYTIFIIGVKMNLKTFFYYTSMLLIFIAGGLAGYGVHEVIEYLEVKNISLGWLTEPAYILDIPRENLLHHKNIIGSILAVMFGYTVKAEWLRLIIHITYLAIMLPITFLSYRKKTL